MSRALQADPVPSDTELGAADTLVARLPATTPAVPALSDLLAVTKPRMNALVVATTAVGFCLVSDRIDWLLLLHTVLGTALTASAASTLNQWLERPWDALMPRTANRPLPAGRMAPVHALVFGMVLSALGVGYLALAVNALTALLGAFTLLLYVAIYTPMKRTSSLCTVVGAIPGALPPVMGCAAATGHLGVEAAALFLLLFVWQMPHFLAIAILYRDDYIAGGFRMLPCLESDLRMTRTQMLVYTAAMIPVSMLPAGFDFAGRFFLISALVLGLAWLALTVRCAMSPTRGRARAVFLGSIIYLPLVLTALLMDAYPRG